MNIICQSCESEFFVETQEEVKYCVTCGDELDVEDEDVEEWLEEYEDEDWEE